MKMSPDPLRIIIADDHEIARYGIRVMLNNQQHLEIVGEATNGLQLIELTEQLRPDIILTDVEMPVLDGLEATRHIATAHPLVTIIALSMYDDVYSIMDMFLAGARGYLLKNTGREEALQAIEKTRNNELYYFGGNNVNLVKLVAAGKYNANAKGELLLTERERQVLNLLCKEYSSKQIAGELNLSIRTVEGHRDNIMEKTGASNIVGIVMYAVRNKLYIP